MYTIKKEMLRVCPPVIESRQNYRTDLTNILNKFGLRYSGVT